MNPRRPGPTLLLIAGTCLLFFADVGHATGKAKSHGKAKIAVTVAVKTVGDYASHPDKIALVDELVSADGFDRVEVDALLDSAMKQQKILDAMERPAEKKSSWAEYQPRFLEKKRVDGGIAFWREHEEALQRASHDFGVPPEIIVSIIGVETYYGRNSGSWRVVDALSTLAFDFPRRAPYFREELKQFVRLGRDAHIGLADVKGSYAGAMGYGQFMPSSYRNFAVDFDADGREDLLADPVDAIGSVANYFHEHGWTPGTPVAARARIRDDVAAETVGNVVNRGLELNQTLAQLRDAGLLVASCIADAPVPEDFCADPPATEQAAAWKLDGVDGPEAWIGFNNFYVITRYNHSEKYALAVFQLSRELRRGKTVADIALNASRDSR